jgi:hypothetical protein
MGLKGASGILLPLRPVLTDLIEADTPIAAEALATSPGRVEHHSFYPFLGFTIETPKVQVDENGGFCRKVKKRPIKLAAHADAAIYAHYGRILAECYEKELATRGLGSCIIAFRQAGGPGLNNITFANQVFDFIEKNRPCVAIGMDVEKFFDRLSHTYLKQRWQATLGADRLPSDHFQIFKSLTDFSWVDRERAYRACGVSPHNPRPRNLWRRRICSPVNFRKQIRDGGLIWGNPEKMNKRGIPQGAPISALLSNIYMLEFDTALQSAVSVCGGLYRRYCDDIAIVVPPGNLPEIEKLASDLIAALFLTINPDKTTHAEFPVGTAASALNGTKIQFLGFDFDGTRRLIRASSLTRYYGKMRQGVSLAYQTWKKSNRQESNQGQALTGLKTRQLYIRYSYLIRRRFRSKASGHERQGENFITYAYRAAAVLSAPEIKHQVRNHFKALQEAIRRVKQQ